MDIDDGLKGDVKKRTATSGKLRAAIGIVAVVATGLLAGLVFERYEVGIPPADASATTELIHVTVSPAEEVPAPSGAPSHHTPAVAGPVCS
jgi:hypothetical protein